MQQAVEKAIEGKVAKILNPRELVINKGSADGVEDQMRFEVVDESQQVRDPDTNELLGEIRRVKIRVRAVEIHPKFSIARTYETYEAPNFAESFAKVMSPRTVTQVKTISTSPEADYEDGKGNVGIGDKVVQIPEV